MTGDERRLWKAYSSNIRLELNLKIQKRAAQMQLAFNLVICIAVVAVCWGSDALLIAAGAWIPAVGGPLVNLIQVSGELVGASNHSNDLEQQLEAIEKEVL